MEVRVGYKQTEVGLIPNEWDVKQLGDCLMKRPSYGINAAAVPYSDRLPAYIRITEITEDGRFSPTERVSVRSEMSGNYYLEDGDIVFARTGASVGKSYRYRPDDGRLVYAGFLIRVRPNVDKLLPAFASAYVTTSDYWRWVRLMSMRSGQPGINGKEYAQLPMPLPPLPEQCAIAEVLSDVDALLEGLDSLIAKKRDLKQAAMQRLLTGQTRLPGFHGEWQEVDFGDIATIRNTKVLALEVSAGTQCVELESIGPGSGRLLMSTDASGLSSKYAFRKGDVLFGRLRAYLRKYWLATFDGICSTEIWPLIARDERLCGGFLHLVVQTNDFVNAAGVSYGTHMPRSDWTVLKKFSVRLPPAPEQKAIAGVLSDMDAELSALEARRYKTRDLKRAMMQELLTGKTRLVAAGGAHA